MWVNFSAPHFVNFIHFFIYLFFFYKLLLFTFDFQALFSSTYEYCSSEGMVEFS